MLNEPPIATLILRSQFAVIVLIQDFITCINFFITIISLDEPSPCTKDFTLSLKEYSNFNNETL